jgi:hypothetical protein
MTSFPRSPEAKPYLFSLLKVSHFFRLQIFVFAPGANGKYLFTGRKDSPLAKGDARIRSVPFSVRRPTFAEAQRVHHQLR